MFEANVQFSEDRIADLLCCAMEGGIGYWGCIIEYIKPKPDKMWKGSGSWGEHVYPHIHFPMSEGGAVILRDAEEDPDDESAETWRLDREALQRGLVIMSEQYPRHFANFVQENEDAETGDVFVQCAVMGKLVFG